MAITCFIRDPIDPFQREAEGRANVALPQTQRFVLREKRSRHEAAEPARDQRRLVDHGGTP